MSEYGQQRYVTSVVQLFPLTAAPCRDHRNNALQELYSGYQSSLWNSFLTVITFNENLAGGKL